MAFCPKCGAQVAEGSQFCPSCGAQLVANQNSQPNPAQPQNNPYAQQGYAPGYGAPQYNQGSVYGQQNYGAPGMISFGQRNIAVAIILTIVTCGLYGIYWMVKLVDELNEASSEPNATSGVMVVLLSIVTCGIYSLIWLYKAGEKINRAKGMRNLPIDSNAGIIYLVLGVFGLSIVSYALLQIELNKVAAFHGAPAA